MNPVPRITALDAFRGVAVVLSVFLVGSLPAGQQYLPVLLPSSIPVAGYHNILLELVRVLFVFAVGMSVPFAVHHMLEQGWSKWIIVFRSVHRGLLLIAVAFAVGVFLTAVSQHGIGTLMVISGLMDFAALHLLFVRLPEDLPHFRRRTYRLSALVLSMIAWLLLSIAVSTPEVFLPTDEGLVMIADVVMVTMVVWTYTRSNLVLRLGLLAFMMAIRIAHSVEASWASQLWQLSPIPWMFHFHHLQYLFIAIPGSIAGGLVLERFTSRSPDAVGVDGIPRDTMRKLRWILLALVILLTIRIGSAGSAVILPIICVVMFLGEWSVRNARRKDEMLIRSLYRWGVFWALLGAILQPADAGTEPMLLPVGFAFLGAGSVSFFFLLLLILTDQFDQTERLRPLILCGRNALAAVMFAVLVLHPIVTSALSILPVGGMLSTTGISILRGLILVTGSTGCSVWMQSRHLAWRT